MSLFLTNRPRVRAACNFVAAVVLPLIFVDPASAQSASIGKRFQQEKPSEEANMGSPTTETIGQRTVESHSLMAVTLPPPKKFAVHDLVTIVVREEKKFVASGDNKTKKNFDVQSQLEAFAKLTNGGLGSTTFVRGKPNIDYSFNTNSKGESDARRKDTFTTRITAEIVDVKPNGNLVVEARRKIVHDEESPEVTLTGVCRSLDITPDNTVLSTQMANLSISVMNHGDMRDSTRRGWIPKMLDALNPF